jgi:hypothetical protein
VGSLVYVCVCVYSHAGKYHILQRARLPSLSTKHSTESWQSYLQLTCMRVSLLANEKQQHRVQLEGGAHGDRFYILKICDLEDLTLKWLLWKNASSCGISFFVVSVVWVGNNVSVGLLKLFASRISNHQPTIFIIIFFKIICVLPKTGGQWPLIYSQEVVKIEY